MFLFHEWLGEYKCREWIGFRPTELNLIHCTQLIESADQRSAWGHWRGNINDLITVAVFWFIWFIPPSESWLRKLAKVDMGLHVKINSLVQTKFGSQILATKFGFVPDWWSYIFFDIRHIPWSIGKGKREIDLGHVSICLIYIMGIPILIRRR